MIYNLDMNMAISLERLLESGLLKRTVLIFSENYDNSGIFIHPLEVYPNFFKLLINSDKANYVASVNLLDNFKFREISLHSLMEIILNILTRKLLKHTQYHTSVKTSEFNITIRELTYGK